jgi:hypothetical protein
VFSEKWTVENGNRPRLAIKKWTMKYRPFDRPFPFSIVHFLQIFCPRTVAAATDLTCIFQYLAFLRRSEEFFSEIVQKQGDKYRKALSIVTLSH